jgi:hypothetical protein
MNETENNCWIHLLKSEKNTVEDTAKIIVLNCSAVLLGDKPASTVTFYNGQPNSSSAASWDRYKEVIFKDSQLRYFKLHSNKKFTLILIFDTARLDKTLNSHEISEFLNSVGYDKCLALREKLYILKSRFEYSIPHEIGIFLGLPLKDVMGFMGLSNLQKSCCKGWRIYGDTDLSFKLYWNYEKCKRNMIHMLSNNINPLYILSHYPRN